MSMATRESKTRVIKTEPRPKPDLSWVRLRELAAECGHDLPEYVGRVPRPRVST